MTKIDNNQPDEKPRFELRWAVSQHDDICYVFDNETGNDVPGLRGEQNHERYTPLIKLLNELHKAANR